MANRPCKIACAGHAPWPQNLICATTGIPSALAMGFCEASGRMISCSWSPVPPTKAIHMALCECNAVAHHRNLRGNLREILHENLRAKHPLKRARQHEIIARKPVRKPARKNQSPRTDFSTGFRAVPRTDFSTDFDLIEGFVRFLKGRPCRYIFSRKVGARKTETFSRKFSSRFSSRFSYKDFMCPRKFSHRFFVQVFV